MRKITIYISFILLLFIVLHINTYAESHENCPKYEDSHVYENKDEAFDHCMDKMRDDIMHFKNYNPDTEEQDADYTFRCKSDGKLYPEDFVDNWYYETGFISSKNVHEKDFALYKDTGVANSGMIIREMTEYASIQVLNTSTYENGVATFTIHLDFKSRISKTQFDIFTEKMDSAFASMDLDNKSDYEKFIAVWEWRAANIRYNNKAEDKGKGLDTIIKGEGVCSGISNALSYMLRRAGLTAYPVGVDVGSDPHEELVVKIDGKYYFNETTMSAQLTGSVVEGFCTNLSEKSKWITRDFVFDTDDYASPDCKYGFHAYKMTLPDDFDCTQRVPYTLVCKNCGHIHDGQTYFSYKKFNNTTPINNWEPHKEIKEEIINEADCTTDGVVKRYCTGCGQYEYVYTPMLGHDYKAQVIQEGGTICGKNEITKYTCSRCGDSYQKITKQAPYSYHIIDAGTVIKKPTLEETGIMEYHCKRCEYSFTEEIPKIKPTETDWTGDDASETQYWTWTKTDTGYSATLTRYYKKDRTIFQTIDATVSSERTEPTCNTSGKTVYTATASFEGHATLTNKKTVSIPSNFANHVWKAPEYQWSNDYSTCTAIRKCTYHSTNKDTLNLTITTEQTAEGNKTRITYTASGTFADGTKAEDTKSILVDRIYEYSNDIEYVWNADYTKCSATRHAIDDDTITNTIELTIQSVESDHECDTPGTITYTATGKFSDGLDASDTKTVNVPAKDHDWKVDITDATCTTDGLKAYECKVCHKKKTETIQSQGHQWKTTKTVDKEATCTEEGQESIHCKNCDAKKDITTIPTIAHDYTSSITKQPTCTQKGTKTFTCKHCHDTYTEDIDAKGHEWNSGKTVDRQPTCTTDGEESIHCKNCNERKDITSIPASHNWDTKKTVDRQPTCTDEGEESIHCKNCNARKDISSINAKGHEWNSGKTVDKKATCTTDGVESIHCKNCNERKDITVIPAGHNWNTEKTIDRQPTCAVQGEKSIHCKNCNARKDIEAIPCNNNHKNTSIINKKDATCMETGYTGDTFCNDCKKTIAYGKTIGKTGHKHTITINKRNATCTTKGYTGDTICNDCKATLSHGKEIAETGHAWNSGVITKQATVDAEGIITFTCNKCHQTRTQSIAKLDKPAQQPQPAEDPALASLPDMGTVHGQLSSTANCNNIYPASYQSFMVKAKAGATSQNITWKRVGNADGYLVYGGPVNAVYQQLANTPANSFAHKGLKKGVYYKYIVLAYKNSGNTQRVLASSKVIVSATTGGKAGNPSKIALVKTKGKISLKRGKSAKINVKVSGKKKTKIKTYKKITFESSNPQIATVNGSGKVVGKAKGTCVIYAYTQNGLSKKITVSVK